MITKTKSVVILTFSQPLTKTKIKMIFITRISMTCSLKVV